MNDYHTPQEENYKKRWITPQVVSGIKSNPVVVLTGARQVGKSTFLLNQKFFDSWKYINLDDFNVLEQAESEPLSLWKNTDNIILDEVQKVPKLLSAVKQTVDKNRQSKRFLLSGSANLLLMEKVSESLAGRATYLYLYPMTQGEMEGRKKPDILSDLFNGELPEEGKIEDGKQKDIYSLMLKGFMPPLLTLKGKDEYLKWWEGYVTTYLERDLRQLSQIESLPDFKRVMEAVALRSGQLINQTEISRDVKVSQPTVHRYINLLETTCHLRRIPAYSKNRTKRLIKSPKFYFIDPGLANYLCGNYNKKNLKKTKEAGRIFESLVLLHLTVLCEMMVPGASIYYWRTASGQEVDFVIEHGKKLIGIEVKLSETAHYKDTANLRIFMDEYPETIVGVLVYTGNVVKYLGENLIAVPWTVFSIK